MTFETAYQIAHDRPLVGLLLIFSIICVLHVSWKIFKAVFRFFAREISLTFNGAVWTAVRERLKYMDFQNDLAVALKLNRITALELELEQIISFLKDESYQSVTLPKDKDLRKIISSMQVGTALVEAYILNAHGLNRGGFKGSSFLNDTFEYEHKNFKLKAYFTGNTIEIKADRTAALEGFKRLIENL